ncbi:MAG: hypothetical protein JSS10_00475 [Verrucomicrobia bacterium]|nr:hypothetical protein [Verrucomicrobiota bacterium]
MVEVSNVENEVINSVSFEPENPLTHFFRSELPRLIPELQQIDRELNFVLHVNSLIPPQYSSESQLPPELYHCLRQNITRCENAWRQAMGEPLLDAEKAIAAAQERLNLLILGNQIQILNLQVNAALPNAENYKLVMKAQKWIHHLRFILAYIAFSTKNLRPEDWQKIKEVFEKNRADFSESFQQKA